MKSKMIKRAVSLLLVAAMIIGISSILSTNSQAEESQWKQVDTMPEAKSTARAFQYKDNVYLFGGFTQKNNSAPNPNVDIYNTKTKKWSAGEDIPTAYAYSNCVQIENEVYVIGGKPGDSQTSDVYVYNMDENHWKKGVSLAQACNGPNPVVLNNKIYVFGPTSGSMYVQVFDLQTNIWTVKPMPYNYLGGAAYTYNNKIYLVGGHAFSGNLITLDNVYIYDPEKNTWSEGTPMPQKTAESAYAFVDDKIYVIGGHDYQNNDKATNLVQIYDIKNDSWSDGPELPTAWNGGAADVINGKIHLFGGIETTEDGTKKYSDKVIALGANAPDTGDPDPDPDSLKLRVLMSEKEQQQLSLNFNLPSNIEYDWKSADDSIVTVDKNGIAQAQANGETEITVKSKDGNFEDKIYIKVLEEHRLAAHILIGKTVRLYLVDDPTSVTWKSSDEKIATVDEKGTVTGVSRGIVKVTAELDGKNHEIYVRVDKE